MKLISLFQLHFKPIARLAYMNSMYLCRNQRIQAELF